jgi:hypothetical protein
MYKTKFSEKGRGIGRNESTLHVIFLFLFSSSKTALKTQIDVLHKIL